MAPKEYVVATAAGLRLPAEAIYCMCSKTLCTILTPKYLKIGPKFKNTEMTWSITINNKIRIFFASTDRHDALFVVGSLDETLELRGLRYHPIDIETSVSRAHRSIAER